MRPFLFLLFAWLMLLPGNVSALDITSVAPNQGEPGTLVTVSGGPFTEDTRVFLGDRQVPVRDLGPRILHFLLPELPPGDYALSLEDGSEKTGQSRFVEILEPTPVITEITPRNVDACGTSADQTIRVRGKHFLPGASLLFDGVVVAMDLRDSGTLEFRIPSTLKAGVYGVQVRNPGGNASLPRSLWVNDIPVLNSVERGEDYVNHYKIILRGKNFYYNSILTVSQPDSSLPNIAHRPLTLHAHRRDNPGRSGSAFQPVPGRLLYVDCQTMIYQRYPSSNQDKRLIFQITNPDGKQSEPMEVFLP
ncbi:IPT/TIG domain-containing protein [Geothermobacter ehrlichii]|uniref:IPT/TIG domain-containing protein n=1 Tax=Geothermobacter ehrlichii TaxID=213224 RepID=A0A5D3WPQ1_9BACT|nr:IPT/TIG domain-containing protein [Geothermobacter ehrlichii]TYO99671.1 IPT/TIG domain-containing protein [Geothermobacter ehrlichii]